MLTQLVNELKVSNEESKRVPHLRTWKLESWITINEIWVVLDLVMKVAQDSDEMINYYESKIKKRWQKLVDHSNIRIKMIWQVRLMKPFQVSLAKETSSYHMSFKRRNESLSWRNLWWKRISHVQVLTKSKLKSIKRLARIIHKSFCIQTTNLGTKRTVCINHTIYWLQTHQWVLEISNHKIHSS